jgi:hypothetical protein
MTTLKKSNNRKQSPKPSEEEAFHSFPVLNTNLPRTAFVKELGKVVI